MDTCIIEIERFFKIGKTSTHAKIVIFEEALEVDWK